MNYGVIAALLFIIPIAPTHASELPSKSTTRRKPRISNAQLQRLRKEQRKIAFDQSRELLHPLPNKEGLKKERSSHLLLAAADPNPVHVEENARYLATTIRGFLLSAFYRDGNHPNLIHWIDVHNRTHEPGTVAPLKDSEETSESENEYISF